MFNPKVDDNLRIILIALIHSKLIDYKTYLPYCDNKILELDDSPEWLLDLSMNSNAYNNNGRLMCCYIEDKSYFKNLLFEDLIIACYYLRYKYHSLGWYEFLVQSGIYSDAFNGKWYCGTFFSYSNEYLESQYNCKLQLFQEKNFLKDYQNEVIFMEEYHEYFKKYYQDF